MSNGRPVFTSRTAFQYLDVDSGEEDELEEIEDDASQEPESAPEPTKPTKSAIKKAQKAARTERRLQQKVASKAKRAQEAISASASDVEAKPTENGLSSSISEVADGIVAATEPEVPPLPSQNEPPVVQHDDVTPPPPEPPLPPPTQTQPVLQQPQLEVKPEPVPEPVPPSVAAPPPPAAVSAADAELAKKRQGFITRTLWTFIMIGGFLGLLLLGHVYMIILVMLCQALAYREVTALFTLGPSKSVKAKSHKPKDPWSKTLNWYFFAVTNYFLYGESIIYYFKHVVFADAQLTPFATNHRIISFTLYTIGFMGFVMSLKKGYLKQQFGLFCWVHMSLMLIVVSSHFIINNILEGLIWFWVPASLVICNDIFAYIWGITVGRTPLIALSPKKTVEGFVGAFFSTLAFSVFWGGYFMRFDYMICPVQNLGVSAWNSVACDPNPVFIWKEWAIWKPVASLLSDTLGWQISTIPYAPYQGHLLFMACFASLVAPFGGFFASGFKRAFDIKDFGDSIPGHGGMTDRMDCQFLMGVFTYVYYSSLIRQHHVTVGSVLQTIVSGLTVAEQVELLSDLKRYLESQGISIVP